MSELRGGSARYTIEQLEKLDRMEYDQLSVIAAIIPYLQERQHVAKNYRHRGGDAYIEHIRYINKQIITLLGLDV